jgi:hypothetical protein
MTSYSAISDPAADVNSLYSSVSGIKQALEGLLRVSGNQGNGAVTWNDLVALGIVASVPSARGVTPASQIISSGVWTPQDNSGAALAFTGVSAHWVQLMGGLVLVSFLWQYPATASGVAASISGLPFPVSNVADRCGGNTYVSTGVPALCIANQGLSTFSFFNHANGLPVTNAALTTAFVLGSFAYMTT